MFLYEFAYLIAVCGFGEGGAQEGAAGVALLGFPFFFFFFFFSFGAEGGVVGRLGIVMVAAAFAEPEAGGGESFVGVVVCVMEGLGADVGEGSEGWGAAVAG